MVGYGGVHVLFIDLIACSMMVRASSASCCVKLIGGKSRTTQVPAGTANSPCWCNIFTNWIEDGFARAAKAGISLLSRSSIPSIRPTPRTSLITDGYVAARR